MELDAHERQQRYETSHPLPIPWVASPNAESFQAPRHLQYSGAQPNIVLGRRLRGTPMTVQQAHGLFHLEQSARTRVTAC